ncbi:MAG TPA: NAD(P)-binding domain-containing protein, partial [Puia sp.]|nr:NAD(P)-binding domain-containing protein [Puia sp.]
AVGLSYYQYLPPAFSGLPETHVTHSSKHKTLDRFKGQQVIVVGAGASALDTAALLHQSGANVRVVARTPVIRLWNSPPPPPASLFQWLREPMSGLGRGWKLYFYANAPLAFRLMPQYFRLDKVKRTLGPSPAWFIKKDIEGKVPLCTGLSIRAVRLEHGRIKLDITDRAGAGQTLEAVHLIAATGYRVDLRRLPFFDSDFLARIRSVENTPILSSNFESSLRGLYFVGTSAANSFGPVLRFAVGARFTARRLSRHLAISAERHGIKGETASYTQKFMKVPYEYANNSANERI